MHAARITSRCTVYGLAALLGLVLAGTATATPIPLPNKSKIEQVDFERHVMGVFVRLGCSAGACHGSFQGKGNFRLSLFGYDPDLDFDSVTRDGNGRRISPTDPDNSLILLKATGQVEHGGLRRMSKDSWQYRILREWIAAGAPRDKGRGTVKAITITPKEYAFQKAGDVGQLLVKARFADGSEEDITPLCDFRTNDENVATVTPLGSITTVQPGDTAIVVAYRGNILPIRVMVPMTPPPGFVYPTTPAVNYIDREVFAKLKRLNIAPSDLSTDSEFLRRVTIDTIGCLPTVEETRAFLASKDPNKRAKKIDELLAHPLHAALWATKFCDITGNNTDSLENPAPLRPKLSQMWHDWFRKRVAANLPYDQIVKGVLCATSRENNMSPEDYIKHVNKLHEAMGKGYATDYADRQTLDLFWRKQQRVPIEQWGEKTAVAFLGVRVECAQCHKHPFDRWTQADYRAYANFFSTVQVGISPDAKKVIDAENAERRKNAKGKNNNQLIQVREMFLSARPVGLMSDPDTGKTLTPKALGGPAMPLESGKDPRLALWEWMRQPDNPFFARSFVNRVWGHYLGIGIVHPVDDFSLANPPSNEKLLDALAKDFVESKFDIRRLERTILLSRTYQLSSSTNVTNKLDRTSYSHCYTRPLMAEVVVDVLNSALGTTENFGNDAPSGWHAIEVGSTRITNPALREAFRVFGRSPRTLTCDCERATEPTVAHKLYLMADPSLQAKLLGSKSRIRELASSKKSNEEILDEIFLGVVCRPPTAREREAALSYLTTRKDRASGISDVMWALINTNEFIFNH